MQSADHLINMDGQNAVDSNEFALKNVTKLNIELDPVVSNEGSSTEGVEKKRDTTSKTDDIAHNKIDLNGASSEVHIELFILHETIDPNGNTQQNIR